MADSWFCPPPKGRLFCLRTRPQPWLEGLAPGLFALQTSRCLRQDQVLWMRLGPDEWWCWGPADATWPDRVPEAAGSHPHALIEISDAQQAFEMPGPAKQWLAQGCELDFERLPLDFASRTRCAAFTVVICPQGQGGWLWVEASLAQSFAQWLQRVGQAVP